ncbi:hypothetical protein SAMN03159343_2041 [Klenkia marina]|uniref:Tyrosine-protein phosphatase domain-containing protein n=1 Tax=Klenkia marina TaxID=1960309 RepID=A0A1G4Y5T5_9ACTN|nr:protein-tyrosine phosphatase family protein [Klenkia marina]SCX48782.1 hypothetical protein SAMN03159343_2041 [Klenkia marina]
MTWSTGDLGIVTLPSGRLVRGRGRRAPLPPGPLPQLGVYLLGRRPEPVGWAEHWVRWSDFRLPGDPAQLRRELGEVLERCADERVELACWGGTGRTGTALACLAVLDGVPSDKAVAWVRARYRPRAVETWSQQRFVRRFPAG